MIFVHKIRSHFGSRLRFGTSYQALCFWFEWLKAQERSLVRGSPRVPCGLRHICCRLVACVLYSCCCRAGPGGRGCCSVLASALSRFPRYMRAGETGLQGRIESQRFVRLYLERTIEQAQHLQGPDNLQQAYCEFSRRVAILSYEVRSGQQQQSLSVTAEALARIVSSSRVRAITIFWQGGNVLHPLVECLAVQYEGLVVNGILLPIEEYSVDGGIFERLRRTIADRTGKGACSRRRSSPAYCDTKKGVLHIYIYNTNCVFYDSLSQILKTHDFNPKITTYHCFSYINHKNHYIISNHDSMHKNHYFIHKNHYFMHRKS